MDRLAHEAARAVMDRSVSPQLMQQLGDPNLSETDRDEVEHTLAVIDDPRCLVVLHAMVDGEQTNGVVRKSALEVLARMTSHPTGDDLRRWWSSGDLDLMGAALPLMERTEADLVQSVLDDPDHPLLSRALLALDFGFEEPWWQQRKMALLSHPEADVRRAAAHCLLWDEPMAAEAPLLAATFDADESVADEAIAALRYYPTKAVLNRMVEYGNEEAYEDVLDYFQMAADEPGEVGERMRAWMPEIAHLLRAPGEPPASFPMIRTAERVMIPWTKELAAAIVNPDMHAVDVHDRIRRIDRESVLPEQRQAVGELLCMHTDSEIRELGASFAVEWGLADLAVALLDDPVASVRKLALYALHDLDRALGAGYDLAARAKGFIDDGVIAGTRSREAVRTWVAHADPVTVLEDLRAYVLNDLRQSVVVGAIEELAVIDGGGPVLAELTDLMRREVLVNWAGPVTMLQACTRLGIPTGLIDQLRTADHVWVATAVVQADLAGVTTTTAR
jgi:hypothetical protein